MKMLLIIHPILQVKFMVLNYVISNSDPMVQKQI